MTVKSASLIYIKHEDLGKQTNLFESSMKNCFESKTLNRPNVDRTIHHLYRPLFVLVLFIKGLCKIVRKIKLSPNNKEMDLCRICLETSIRMKSIFDCKTTFAVPTFVKEFCNVSVTFLFTFD